MARRTLKVCVLGSRGIPDVLGGVEAHCEALYPLLAKREDLRIVFLARRNYVAAPRYDYKGVDVRAGFAPRHAQFEAIVHTLLGVFSARFTHRADIVHFHGIGPALLAPVAKLLGMRVIVTHHSRNYLHQKWNAAARAALRFGEWCAGVFADRIIAVSPSMAVELRGRHPRQARRITHIPNGAPDFGAVPSEAEQQSVLDRFGVKPGGFVLAVGRLTPEKGFHDLVAAFEQTGGANMLVIAGKADFENDYSQALLAHASERIVFAGFQDRRTLQALYAQTALFVLPSHHEGMPIAALEALSCGAPILMSDIEACRDLDLPHHHYYPVGDIAALAERLSDDGEALRYNAVTMLRRYQWDEIARRTGALYGELADELAGRSSQVIHSAEESRS